MEKQTLKKNCMTLCRALPKHSNTGRVAKQEHWWPNTAAAAQ